MGPPVTIRDIQKYVKPEPESYPPEWAVYVSHRGQWDKEYPINQRFVFPLTVERSSPKMIKKAQALSDEIFAKATYPPKEAIQALFSLSGKPAQRVQWGLVDALASQPNRGGLMLVLREVARLNTPEAIDFVAACIWNRKIMSAGELVTVFYLWRPRCAERGYAAVRPARGTAA